MGKSRNRNNQNALRHTGVDISKSHAIIQIVEDLRVEHKISQAELSSRVNLCHAWWYTMLTRSNPCYTIERIDRLLNLFGLELAVVKMETDEPVSAVRNLDTSMMDENSGKHSNLG